MSEHSTLTATSRLRCCHDYAFGNVLAATALLNAGDSDELTYEELCRAHIEAFIHAAGTPNTVLTAWMHVDVGNFPG